jgi:hypothetical protein
LFLIIERSQIAQSGGMADFVGCLRAHPAFRSDLMIATTQTNGIS